MTRMASRPRIGALIRDGMERKLMDQRDLAAALKVSRSTVNAWINDRTWPANRIAALEELLGIKIPRSYEPPASLTSVRDRELFRLLLAQIEDMTPDEALAIIRDDKQRRAKRRTA
jgi:transcriptional regulator with XRE-family HTH domain